MTVAARERRRAARARRRGLTLLELLLVMGLLALVLGTSLGAFASIDAGQRAALGQVQNIVRTAHNSAVASRAPARVRIDPAAGTATAYAMRVVGTWHFEDDDLRGGDDLDAVAVGFDATGAEDGFLGRGLELARAPRGARVEVAVQDDPGFDPRQGFAIDVALRTERAGPGRILSLGDAVVLELTETDGLKLSFRRRTTDQFGATAVGGNVVAQSAGGLVSPGRWLRVAAQYDRRVLRVLVDGIPVAALFADDEVAPLAGPLELGGGKSGFPGALDELRIAVVTGDQTTTLPNSVHFVADVPRVLEFLAGGALDPVRHREPVHLTLEHDDGRTEVVVVNLYGTVE